MGGDGTVTNSFSLLGEGEDFQLDGMDVKRALQLYKKIGFQRSAIIRFLNADFYNELLEKTP